MDLKKKEIDIFLSRNFLNKEEIVPIESDASFRKYYRVKNKKLLIMYAPKAKGESVSKFRNIDEKLISAGISAPIIYDYDEKNDFMLIEDFGEDIFSKIIDKECEEELYKKAISLLANIYSFSIEKKISLASLDDYSSNVLIDESNLFIEWYLRQHLGILLSEKSAFAFKEIIKNLFYQLKLSQKVLVLRDYHVDNLIHLKDRENIKQVGIIDFQDALIGSPAYDIASLVEDVRRPISIRLENKLKEYYALLTEINLQELDFDTSFFSIQRNLKILGIFFKLKYRDKKESYMKYIENAWRFINFHIEKPEFIELREWIEIHLKKNGNY